MTIIFIFIVVRIIFMEHFQIIMKSLTVIISNLNEDQLNAEGRMKNSNRKLYIKIMFNNM
jgi:hypothetical protein